MSFKGLSKTDFHFETTANAHVICIHSSWYFKALGTNVYTDMTNHLSDCCSLAYFDDTNFIENRCKQTTDGTVQL